MATDRNTRGKNALEFGKATMYVISEGGLQTESSIPTKATEDQIFLDKAVFSGKKVNFSHTRSLDFSWKEVAKSSKQDKELRILNMNELAVNDKIKTVGFPEKTRYFADTFEKSTAEKKPKRQKISKAQNRKGERVFEKNEPPCSHDVDSLKTEQTFEPFEDVKTTGSSQLENDSENSSPFYKDCTFQDEKLDKPGKCYLKRIFYSKGHLQYSKPSNIRCLPQIARKSENCESAKNSQKVDRNSSSSGEVVEENNIYKRGNNKLFPLNINVKTSEAQKHNLKSMVKLPTVVDKTTGEVHLSLEAIAFEQSDYNKWSRRRQQTKLENTKMTSFSFPLIAKK
ncbi:hypothetical protein AWC38_SpisGene3671 [Stylophora pistillata]|uniref:Uncharacterized protein n=1 Tax=Stylophora pistillata TaxID=50429 RepID=A0A2B4SQ99_STYPI|nr:hypothetical protein AWC38_SpisGene3671 [Stylophora pistillata]